MPHASLYVCVLITEPLFSFSVLGTVKIQHLMKFITMKYGLNSESFVVDVIYKGDIIPQDYTLIDVAYYYKWEKNAPMQFFYRIFKKNKVLLKRRKRKSKSEDKISDGKKPRHIELSNNKNDSNQNSDNKNNNNNNKSNSGKSNNSESAKNGSSEIIGCRTVSTNSAGVHKSPPCLKKQDETGGQKTKSVHEKKVGFKLDQAPAEKEVKTNSKAKGKVKCASDNNTTDKKEAGSSPVQYPGPPILKPEMITKIVAKKETNHVKVINNGQHNNEDSSDEDDDKPPSEKKLKIDESTLKIDESIENNCENQTNNIKIKVSADDVKKVEPKASVVQTELTKVLPKKEVGVINNKVNNHCPKKESAEIKDEKPVKTALGQQQQQDKKPNVNVIKPKLLPVSSSPSSTKQKSTANTLGNIVNNLAKKQLGATFKNNDTNVQASKAQPPKSILGGQTTITKKDVKKDQVNPLKNNVKKCSDDFEFPDISKPKDISPPKGIPKDTSVTVRSVASTGSTASSTSTAKVSFSNSFKSKNGSNSMMDFVKASNQSPKSSSSPTSNGLSPSKQQQKSSTSSTLSDLRQFRKDSGNKTMPNGTPVPTPVTSSNHQTPRRSPIVPSLTSRNLTFGNSKSVGQGQQGSKTSSNSSSNNSKSSPPSSFSAVLSKPLPKPGEASSATANSFLAQANNLSALAALGGLGANLGAFTDEQQRAFLRNMAAVGMFQPPIAGLHGGPAASVTQQLPSNRLKLTVSQAKNNSPVNNSVNQNPLQMLPSLASHMSPESQWKMFSPLAAAAAAQQSGNIGSNGLNHHHSNNSSKYSSLSKNLNQSIRQIPNPSLLTKQASEAQQQQLLQRAIASQVSAAAAVAAANARTSLSQ